MSDDFVLSRIRIINKLRGIYTIFSKLSFLFLEMERAPLTTSQLKAIFQEFNHSESGALSFAQFKAVCSSHRDLLIPQSYSESDFNSWMEE